jgi:hypothetical protein
MIQDVRADLKLKGWPEPILGDSGNGYHLLYRIDLPTEESGLVRRVLHALAEAHDRHKVKIDRTVFDSPRICKLPYTLACKGGNTPDRPHRLACVVKMPAELQVVTQAKLDALAGPVDTSGNSQDGSLGERPVVLYEYLPLVVQWASNYVKWMNPAIEGKGGDAQTFKVICTLENDFALPFEATWRILLKRKDRCDPPWDEDELVRKWNYAEATAKGRCGTKLLRRIRRQLKPPS